MLSDGLQRRLSKAEALTRLGPELQRHGITRVARQTALDVIGIPCYAAIRPNSATLAVHQGKGGDDAGARLSAVMEAVEFSVAEAPTASRTLGSMQELHARGLNTYCPLGKLPRGHPIDRGLPMSWLEGECLVTGATLHVPVDSAALISDASDPLPFSQSSNGLGAGFSKSEATVHALCELIERDASTLWSLGSVRRCARTEVALAGVMEAEVVECLATLTGAGISIKAFDLTSDLGVPVFMVLLWSGTARTYFDVASGVCAHPSSTKALMGAIHEAAQTRISNIAGSRDDIEPAEYERLLPSWIADIIGASSADLRPGPPPMSNADFSRLPALCAGEIVAVTLTAPSDTVSVVRIISDSLEDRSTNVHWRPGKRALKAMMQT